MCLNYNEVHKYNINRHFSWARRIRRIFFYMPKKETKEENGKVCLRIHTFNKTKGRSKKLFKTHYNCTVNYVPYLPSVSIKLISFFFLFSDNTQAQQHNTSYIAAIKRTIRFLFVCE